MESTGKITINFEQEGFEQYISVTQYDTGKKVRCNIAGISGNIGVAMVYCKKPSGLETYTDADIVDDHTVEFYITEQMNAEIGCAKCQLQLFGEDKSLTSYKFKIMVQENMIASSRVESADDYPAFRDAIEKYTKETLNLSNELKEEKELRETEHASMKAQCAEAVSTEKSERQAADAAEKSERMQEIAVERARINNLIANNNPTEGNSELIDIRVGADGKTYDTAGDAVRANDKRTLDILSKDNLFYGKFIYDGFIASGGTLNNEGNPPGFKATAYIKIPDSVKKILFVSAFLYEEAIAFYDDEHHGISVYNKNSTGFDSEKIVVLDKQPNWKYVRYGVYHDRLDKCGLYFFNTGFLSSPDVIVKPNLSGFAGVKLWLAPSGYVTFYENYIKISNPGLDTTGNYGVQTNYFYSTNPIKNPIVCLDITIRKGNIMLYIAGKKKKDAASTIIIPLSDTIAESTKIEKMVDLSYYDVYSDLDLNSPMYFILSSSIKRQNDIDINTFTYYFDEFDGSGLPGNTLTDTINNIQKELNKKADSGSIPSGSSDTTLISPNGNKFVPVITDEGDVSYVPVIPDKTLFIGNSLLLGWGTFGMCAKDSKHDYYHYIKEYILSKKEESTFDKISGTTFEGATSITDADDWMTNTLRSKLSNDLDLVIIQLSDNVNTDDKIKTFHSTCIKLIQYIRSICKKARIVWVSAWYATSEKQAVIREACKNSGSIHINISDLTADDTNKGKIGDTIHKDDGSTSVVDSSGVASHPGNKGMRLISNRILYSLGISDQEETYDNSYDD